MKQNIIYLILGLCIGMLIMINQVCKQKDSQIRLLMSTKVDNNIAQTSAELPKLPIINFK